MALIDSKIAQSAKSMLPITWDALTKDGRYGQDLVQSQVDLAKETLFGRVIENDEEENYPLRVLNYAGKLVAYSLVTPGVDFWMSQVTAITTTGTSEVTAYTDRANRLEELGKRLDNELRRDRNFIYSLLGEQAPATRRGGYIGVNTEDPDVFQSADPRTFGSVFRQA